MKNDMSARGYLKLFGFIFLLIGVVHIVRYASGWAISINNWMVPDWASLVATIVCFALAGKAFKAAGK